MRLHLMNGAELRTAYETDLTEAFPPSELKPLFAMEDLRSKGLYDPLCFLEDDGTILGYALLWRHRDGRYILIDYLCVPIAASEPSSLPPCGHTIPTTPYSSGNPKPP